jgi:hypothetical protein
MLLSKVFEKTTVDRFMVDTTWETKKGKERKAAVR